MSSIHNSTTDEDAEIMPLKASVGFTKINTHKEEIIIKNQNLFMLHFMHSFLHIGQSVDFFSQMFILFYNEVKMFVDVHAHLIDEKFENPRKVVETANFFGVSKIIVASSNFITSKKSQRFAQENENGFVAVGVHPEDCEEYDKVAADIEKIAKAEKVVAIGEIGLDYHYEGIDKEKQKDAFEKQILLAHKLNLPIVIHSRDAMDDTLRILKKHKDKLGKGGIFHCYSGSVEEAKEILKLGFSFSFGGVCTFKNARKVVEVLEFLPIEKIMLETDCPYLAPEPYRGQVNEPKNIPYIAEKIASIKGLSLEEVGKITTENAERMFKI